MSCDDVARSGRRSHLRERPLPKLAGREGAMFTIYWGEVSADSDGPVEMCRPVPEADATTVASHFPS